MSIAEPIKEETNGATNQTLSLNLSNTCTSNNCAVKKAMPDPIAILLDIKFEKSVEKYKVKNRPNTKPI